VAPHLRVPCHIYVLCCPDGVVVRYDAAGEEEPKGCTKIFREKVTGAHNDRRQLLNMLKRLAPGDEVTVTRIDRLARSTFDLFAIVKRIVDAKAQFRLLAAHPVRVATTNAASEYRIVSSRCERSYRGLP
jgi:hypothetical protein